MERGRIIGNGQTWLGWKWYTRHSFGNPVSTHPHLFLSKPNNNRCGHRDPRTFDFYSCRAELVVAGTHLPPETYSGMRTWPVQYEDNNAPDVSRKDAHITYLDSAT